MLLLMQLEENPAEGREDYGPDPCCRADLLQLKWPLLICQGGSIAASQKLYRGLGQKLSSRRYSTGQHCTMVVIML